MYESVAAKLSLNNYLISNSIVKGFQLKEIDFDRSIDLCKKYKVTGVPTTMIYHNDSLFYRHLGELSHKELDSLFERITSINKIDKNKK